MNKVCIGVVDYDMGNHASVVHTLRVLNFRVILSSLKNDLDNTDIIVLPGVGAFPNAMEKLTKLNLVGYLQEKAVENKPILGICLGMQLLAGGSYEHGYHDGLNMIPGLVKPLQEPKWHIGWNTIDCQTNDELFTSSNGEAFYFNHSYAFDTSSEYQISTTTHNNTFTSIVRNNKVIGLQFHPEKSQASGRILLKEIINGIISA